MNEIIIGNCRAYKRVDDATRRCDRIGQPANISLNPEASAGVMNNYDIKPPCAICLSKCGFNQEAQPWKLKLQSTYFRTG